MALQVDIVNHAASVTINFNNDTADGNGVKWWITTMEGWELPEPRQQWLNRVGTHGAIPALSVFNKRDLVINGLCNLVATETIFWTSWNKLCSLFSSDIEGDVNYGTFTVHELPTSRYVFVKLAGRPKHVIHAGYFEFQLPLTCPDPKRYLTGAGTPGSGGNPGIF